MKWVIKIGGSLFDSSTLVRWLALLSHLPEGEAVILVPGGGPFAEKVRSAQNVYQFSDRIAHRMALLAMEQYGIMISGISEGGTTLVDTQVELPSSWQSGQSKIWLPDIDILDNWKVPSDWDTTSDSIAAFVAARSGADHLILVKSATIESANRSVQLEDFRELDLLDSSFPATIRRLQPAYRTWLWHKDKFDDMGKVLRKEGPPERYCDVEVCL